MRTICALLLFILAGAAAAEPGPAPFPDYQPVAGWFKPPPSLKLGPVSAVATDAAQRVIVLQRAEPPVLIFDREGELIRTWGEGFFKTPHGMRIDRDGNVWVTDIGRHLVVKFNAQGKPLLTLGKADEPGAGPDHFNKPTDVAVTESGEIYVTDGYGNSRVARFSKEGKFLAQWGSKGTGPGDFNLPHCICLDGRGRVYVGDRENNRVQVFDTEGKFIAQWTESGAPYGLYLSQDRAFIADGRAQEIVVLDLQGKLVGRWSTGPGDVNSPHWVHVDKAGAVFVAYVGGQRVEKFIAR